MRFKKGTVARVMRGFFTDRLSTVEAWAARRRRLFFQTFRIEPLLEDAKRPHDVPKQLMLARASVELGEISRTGASRRRPSISLFSARRLVVCACCIISPPTFHLSQSCKQTLNKRSTENAVVAGTRYIVPRGGRPPPICTDSETPGWLLARCHENSLPTCESSCSQEQIDSILR